MQALTLTVPAAVLMGFAFGAGPCNIACLPYLGPVFLARDGGIRSAWRTIVPFSVGRIAGYALLGAVAGTAGQMAARWFEGYAGPLLGGATLLAGLLLLVRSSRSRAGCGIAKANPAEVAPIHRKGPSQPSGALLPVSLFGMGAAMALNPCVPLATVVLAAAATGQLGAGLVLGLGFGAGAVVIPAIVFGLLVAHFGEQIRFRLAEWGRAIERGAAGLLVLLGAGTAMGWVGI